MKKTLISIARSICRLVSSALWQLVWLIPLGCLCWYGKAVLPLKIRTHFNVDQLQDRLFSLEKFADLMKDNVSISNPTALVHYLSAQLTKFSTTTKLNTIEMASNLIQTICLWGLNLIWIAAVVYAVIRTIRLYRAKTEIYTTAQTVSALLQPQLLLLQQEVASLREEIKALKTPPTLIENNHRNLPKAHE